MRRLARQYPDCAIVCSDFRTPRAEHPVSNCGTRTEVGPWGLPRERIDAAGRYPDGAVADPLHRALVASGWDRPVLAGVILVHVGLFVWLAWSIRRHRHRVAHPCGR